MGCRPVIVDVRMRIAHVRPADHSYSSSVKLTGNENVSQRANDQRLLAGSLEIRAAQMKSASVAGKLATMLFHLSGTVRAEERGVLWPLGLDRRLGDRSFRLFRRTWGHRRRS